MTPDREIKTSISLFYRTEQLLELHVDSETSPQRGHALCSGVGNCVPTLVKWREDSILYAVKPRDGTIPYMVQYTAGLPQKLLKPSVSWVFHEPVC